MPEKEYVFHGNMLYSPKLKKGIALVGHGFTGKTTMTVYARHEGLTAFTSDGIRVKMSGKANATSMVPIRLEKLKYEAGSSSPSFRGRWKTDEKVVLQPSITEEEALHHIVLMRVSPTAKRPSVSKVTKKGLIDYVRGNVEGLIMFDKDIDELDEKGLMKLFDDCKKARVTIHKLTIPKLKPEEAADDEKRKETYLKAWDILLKKFT